MKLRQPKYLIGITCFLIACICLVFLLISDNKSKTLTINVTEKNFSRLDNYTSLEKLDFSESTCYDNIIEYEANHPEVDVRYKVKIGDYTIRNSDEKLKYLSSDSSALIQHAKYLPNLRQINLGKTEMSSAEVNAIRAAFPDCHVICSVNILGRFYSSDTNTLSLTNLTHGDVEAVAAELPKFSSLEYADLLDKSGNPAVDTADLEILNAASPDTLFNYKFHMFDRDWLTTDERIIYKVVHIGNDGVEHIREVLPYMKRLAYLRLDRCDIDNEVMAQLRDDFPDVKIVWRIFFGDYTVLTDTERLFPYCGMRNEYVDVLKYCTDVKYIDMGHGIETDLSFVKYMPNLEVLIVALTPVSDISDLACCKNLEYLEIDDTPISDVSPLAGCTNLQHLNMGETKVTDISPLYGLKNLKRFYCENNNIPDEQMEKFIELHPDCENKFGYAGYYGPLQYGWRYGEPLVNGFQERYYLLRQQFGYDHLTGVSILANDPER